MPGQPGASPLRAAWLQQHEGCNTTADAVERGLEKWASAPTGISSGEREAWLAGFSANVLVDSVMVILEQAINGVQDMKYIISDATSAGEATIQVIFEPGTDPNVAVMNVNNRVQMVKNNLPPIVEREGIVVRRPLVDEINWQTVDLGGELIESIQRPFAGPPVVCIGPVGGEFLGVIQRDALAPVVDAFTFGPAGSVQALTQIGQVGVGDRDAEGLHGRHGVTVAVGISPLSGFGPVRTRSSAQ